VGIKRTDLFTGCSIIWKIQKPLSLFPEYGVVMPHMLVHHKVRDFGKWIPFFDRDESRRKTSGSKSAQVFQNVEDPTDVFILFEWDSAENARKFGKSEDLKKIMEQAGVIGIPHMHILKEVQESSA
jgi:heme-degrading monooxygenase HmoA